MKAPIFVLMERETIAKSNISSLPKYFISVQTIQISVARRYENIQGVSIGVGEGVSNITLLIGTLFGFRCRMVNWVKKFGDFFVKLC